jgi:hypothetical protein
MATGLVYFFQIRSVGGAVADVPPDATAFANRDANFSVVAFGADRTRLDEAWEDLYPASAAFEELIEEGASAPVEGWDFSWFAGRATEERPSWGYATLAAGKLADAGGAQTSATAGWRPRWHSE